MQWLNTVVCGKTHLICSRYIMTNDWKLYKHTSCKAINILFQVDVGNNSYIHLRVFKTLPHVGGYLELNAVKTGLTKEDSLDYFEK